MKIKLEGINELRVALDKAASLDAVKQVVRLNGSELQQKAMQTAPYDTGTLRRSIMLDIEDNGLTAKCTALAEYAPYVEWGTRYMDAQPFMRPSFNKQAPTFENDIHKVMGDI